MKTPCLDAEFAEIAQELLRRGWMMATAESCTGGAVAAACTDIPGSSAWFAGALVTYTVPWKVKYLGVPQRVVDEAGVVSEEVVSAMLDGLRRECGVQAGIAVSGIAGPTGAEPGKPVGTVVVGVDAGARRYVEMCHFPGDREGVRAAVVAFGVRKLREMLRETE